MKSWRRASGLAATAVVLVLLAPEPTRAVCTVDCNSDGEVDLTELIVGVDILLARSPLDECRALDRDVDGVARVDEIVSGVRNAIEGCPAPRVIVFNGEANRLNAYAADVEGPDFPKQTVIPNSSEDKNGRDINAQICFRRAPDGTLHFIAGEDTNQPNPPQGWGFFRLDGSEVGELSATQVGKLTPTYQAGAFAENYGCGFLGDGRLLTTDVGNQAFGPPNGQLILWFPPFDEPDPKYCKIDVAIGTAQQIAVDSEDRAYVSSARVNPGVFRYAGTWPTSDDASGGCGRTDSTGAPLVDAERITKIPFIVDMENLPTTSGVVQKPDGGFYVASVFNGVIAEYDSAGQFVRRILEPGDKENPPFPSTGNPLGIGLASDGTLYYADIALVVDLGPPIEIGPGDDLGRVRRIRFVDGEPEPPETMDDLLNFPDGIGILEQ